MPIFSSDKNLNTKNACEYKHLDTPFYLIARFSSQLTCFNQRSHLRGEGTSSRGWCSIQTLSSWTSRQVFIIMIIVCHNVTCPPRSAPAVTGSPPSSRTRTPSWSAPAAPPCCVSPPGAGPSSQKASTRVTEQLSVLILLIPFRMCLPKKELIYISGDFDNVFYVL